MTSKSFFSVSQRKGEPPGEAYERIGQMKARGTLWRDPMMQIYGAECFEARKELYMKGVDNEHVSQRRKFGQRSQPETWGAELNV